MEGNQTRREQERSRIVCMSEFASADVALPWHKPGGSHRAPKNKYIKFFQIQHQDVLVTLPGVFVRKATLTGLGRTF